MAWGVKYSKKFQNLGVNTTYRIDISSEAGGAVITPWKMGADPLQLRSLGAEKDENKIVIGSEIAFEFVLNKHNGEADYDALFASEYREHIVELYNDDTSELLFQGYLQPENMYKSIFESNLHIYLSATDALKDLADFRFLDAGEIISGRLTGLEIIKLCLTNLGLGDLYSSQIIVKLSTKPDGMVDDDHTALAYVTHDTRRFSRSLDGNTEVDNCLTVIEKVLGPYSCTLQQYGGKYYIKELYEQATWYYTYGWNLALIGSRAASSDVINIDTYKFSRESELSLMSPVKEMKLKLLNRNMGDEEVSDINDFSALGPWDFTTGFPVGDVIDEDPNLHVILNEGNELSPRSITLTSTFPLIKVTDNDYIKLRFNILCYGPGLTPLFKIRITKPDGTHDSWDEIIWLNNHIIYESPNNDVFLINQTGDYNVTIIFDVNPGGIPVYTVDIFLQQFSIIHVVSIDETTYTDFTFDKFLRAISDQGKRINEEKDIYFADTEGVHDIAALVYSAANTTVWDRAAGGDGLPLIQLYALNYLTNRKIYSEYIILSIKDRNDTITPVNYISFESKYYDIVSYEKRFRSSWVTVHLKQKTTGDITLDFQETIMTSIDGQSTGGQVINVVSGSGSYPSSGIALSTGYSWGSSITNNSTNWNTAYGWGNHASAGYAPLASPTFTGTVTTPSLIVEDLTDGYIPYQKAADDKLSDSIIYYDGTNVGIRTATPDSTFMIGETNGSQLRINYNSTGENYIDATKHRFRSASGASEFVMFDGATLRVGIGLSAPDTLLHLYSATDVHLRLAKSTTGRYDIAVGTLTANNDFWIEDIINSTAPFYINNSGNVGIGTITPQVRTDIKNVATAAIASLSASPNGTFNIGSYDTTGIMNFGQYGGTYGWIQVRNTAANGEAYPLVLNPLGGNVGIGNASPTEKLQVETSTANHYAGYFYNSAAAGDSFGIAIIAGGNSDDYSLRVQDRTAGSDYFVIRGDGNIGIGITTPNEIISVYKGSAANVLAQFINSNTGSAANDGFFIGIESDGTAILNQKESGLLALATNGLVRAQFTSGGNFQHPSFVTGWETAGGTKWQIDIDGNAELENLIVRGSARFRELIIDQLAIIAGSQLLSVARGKILSVDTVNSKVTLDDPNDVGASAFAVDDFFWIKNIDIDRSIFSDCKGQISAITDVTLTLDFGVAGASGAITDITEGDIIVQRGHPSTASRQNLIYTTVSDTGAPFRRVMTGIDSLAAFTDLDNVVSQEGNLDTLDSHDIVPASPGYGYYSSNVYLSGKIVADSGSIANWAISASAISTGAFNTNGTMYFGTSGLSLSDTFKVTSAGVLTANSGTIGGFTISADALYSTGGIWSCSLESDTGNLSCNAIMFYNAFNFYNYSQQSTPYSPTAAQLPFYVCADIDTESTFNLPSSGLPGSGESRMIVITHKYGSGLGSGKYHIDGNGYYIYSAGVQLTSYDLDEGESILLVWEPRGDQGWYIVSS